MANKSILSISSHVVHGYVGNRAAVFPLQYLGWDVDAVNTTNLSNHPGYGKFAGKASSPQLLDELFQGIKKIVSFNDTYSIILTGYIPSVESMEIIYNQLVQSFQACQKAPAWIVDPILGDNGKLYLPGSVVEWYKKFFASGYVTLTTPNQFEFETLTGIKIDSWDSLKLALLHFYNTYKVPYVVVSSVEIQGQLYSVGFSGGEQPTTFYFELERLDCSFSGCGDLFTALVANAFYNNGKKLVPDVLSDALTKLQKVLKHSYAEELAATGLKEVKVVKDIRVVSSRRYLLESNLAYTDPQYL